MVVFPNAKINIGLNITSKREDGYHNIESIFYPIGLKDALEVLPQDPTVLDSSMEGAGRIVAGGSDDNLVMKAYHLLEREGHKVKPVKTFLYKNIPMGAGLGGGSADASFMLKCLNEVHALHLTQDELLAYALQLGADCPFFIHNTPAYVTGVGEIFEPTSLDLSNYYLVLVYPEIHIPTKDAFRGIVPKPSGYVLTECMKQDPSCWKGVVRNDFEDSVFKLHPELGAIKADLYAQGALYASMSGSGSSIYGIFAQETNYTSPHFVWQGHL